MPPGYFEAHLSRNINLSVNISVYISKGEKKVLNYPIGRRKPLNICNVGSNMFRTVLFRKAILKIYVWDGLGRNRAW